MKIRVLTVVAFLVGLLLVPNGRVTAQEEMCGCLGKNGKIQSIAAGPWECGKNETFVCWSVHGVLMGANVETTGPQGPHGVAGQAVSYTHLRAHET